MAGAGLIRKLLGRSVSEGAAFAMGAATAPSLRPFIRQLENEVNARFRYWPLPAEAAARAVAEGQWTEARGDEEAAAQGLPEDAFRALIYNAHRGPTLGEALELWRRGDYTDAQMDEALQKAAIAPEFRAGLKALYTLRLSPQEVAIMVQRGVLPNPGWLPVGPPSDVGKVPPMPEANLDPVKEAAAGGFDSERAAAITRIIGLPPAPGELLQLLNRGVILEADYFRGIAEGNTRNEWAPFLLELKRRLLTPHEYAELRIRGWIDDAAMHAGAAQSGMTTADTDLLEKMIGRPLNIHQVTTGEARGGAYNGPTAGIPEAYLRSLQEGNLRPEWYALAYANRYTLPSAFVIRRLQDAGVIDAARAHTLYLESGWPPDLAAAVSGAAGTAPGATSKALTKAELSTEFEGGYITEAEYRTALEALGYAGAALELEVNIGNARRDRSYRDAVISTIHDAYTAHEIDDAEAQTDLASVQVTGDAAQRLVSLWALERRYTRTRLTEAQVVKAYKKGLLAQTDALARLADFGLSPADAQIRLQEG